MSVYEEIQREITDLGVSGTSPGMAAAALALAGAIDLPTTGATAAANAVAQLRMVMADLRELAPVDSAGDVIDELTSRRKARQSDAS